MSEGEMLQNGKGEEEGGAPFYVNRGGLPVDEPTWERMWAYVVKTHPEGEELVRRIREAKELPRVPVPCIPSLNAGVSVPERVEAIQRYIRELQYLTNSISGLERFPISFKTQFSGGCFRHIVLGLYWGGHFGALGMSRREDLMFKPLIFRTLSELLADFQAAYSRCWHTLRKIKLGPYISHDPHSVEQIDWKHSVLDLQELGAEGLKRELERHSREMRLRITKGPPSPTKERKRDITSSPQRAQSSPHRRERPERHPSGEKPSDSTAIPDLSGYQIRV
ncbi:tubulinyl-Tyr carboxypeptidase 1 isoform X2 [Bombina bombina]|uniref:tubulinyl-Tyr carboxypeptidase 1 isoform X2 n=1 Tax=Bombina bombina TaxID=8345 RepID=UPI00235A5F65|nr:tubulinyl-Tyr carboxypeptidase 1 isoform X2 [Bombina bombina]